jgi:hypothetical protein
LPDNAGQEHIANRLAGGKGIRVIEVGQNVVYRGQIFVAQNGLNLVLNIPVSGVDNGAVKR